MEQRFLAALGCRKHGWGFWGNQGLRAKVILSVPGLSPQEEGLVTEGLAVGLGGSTLGDRALGPPIFHPVTWEAGPLDRSVIHTGLARQ